MPSEPANCVIAGQTLLRSWIVTASSEKFSGFVTTPLISPMVFATVPSNTPRPATTPGSTVLLAAFAPLTNLSRSSAATSTPCSMPRSMFAITLSPYAKYLVQVALANDSQARLQEPDPDSPPEDG